MRDRFAKELTEIAKHDTRVWLLTADVGFTVLEPFARAHPDRYINVGVAEQNMIAIAAGLATQGMIPFCYSIATFATMRPFEFIRHACYENLPIRVVGSGRGKEYGHNGFTHWSIESLKIMSCLPNIECLEPPTAEDLASSLRGSWDKPNPLYINLKKNA